MHIPGEGRDGEQEVKDERKSGRCQNAQDFLSAFFSIILGRRECEVGNILTGTPPGWGVTGTPPRWGGHQDTGMS